MEFRYAVDRQTGQFVYGGPEPYDCADGLSPGQIRVVTDRHVDVVGERWNAVMKQIRPATAQEQTDAVSVQQAAKTERVFQGTDLGPIVKQLVADVAALKAAGKP